MQNDRNDGLDNNPSTHAQGITRPAEENFVQEVVIPEFGFELYLPSQLPDTKFSNELVGLGVAYVHGTISDSLPNILRYGLLSRNSIKKLIKKGQNLLEHLLQLVVKDQIIKSIMRVGTFLFRTLANLMIHSNMPQFIGGKITRTYFQC